MKAYLPNIVSISLLLLFVLNYPLAQVVYDDNTFYDENIAFRFNEYAVIVLLALVSITLAQNKWSSFVNSVTIGVSISDVMDRFYFDITEFRWNDILMLSITIIISYRKYLWKRY